MRRVGESILGSGDRKSKGRELGIEEKADAAKPRSLRVISMLPSTV